MIRRAHFLKYISYFIFGAPIPDGAMAEFANVAKKTFREWDDLAQLGKKLVPKVLAAQTIEDYDVDDAFSTHAGLWLEPDGSQASPGRCQARGG